MHGAVPAIMPFLTEKLSPEQYRQSLISLFKVTAPAAIITYPEFKAEIDQAILAGGEPSPVRVVLLNDSIPALEKIQDSDFFPEKRFERLKALYRMKAIIDGTVIIDVEYPQ